MSSTVILEGEITLHNLDRWYERLQSILEAEGDVTFNCTNLIYLDTAAFQLLVALKKSLNKRALVFQNVPSEVITMGELLGLNTFLKLGG
jgi:anti-anti-sigma regulatory factor